MPPFWHQRLGLAHAHHRPDLLAALNLFQANEHYHPDIDQAQRLLFSADDRERLSDRAPLSAGTMRAILTCR